MDNLTEKESEILANILEIAVNKYNIKTIPYYDSSVKDIQLVWSHIFKKDRILFLSIIMDRTTTEIKYSLDTKNQQSDHHTMHDFLLTLSAIDTIKRLNTKETIDVN